jgi:hypothetical protein
MNEHRRDAAQSRDGAQGGDAAQSAIELRSAELFRAGVDGLDMRTRSRLARARHAALEAAGPSRGRPWFLHRVWAPAAGVAAAVMLGVALWLGSPPERVITAADSPPGLEDLDLVASSDEGSGDAMEMLQNDLDFYDFADKAANPGPAA